VAEKLRDHQKADALPRESACKVVAHVVKAERPGDAGDRLRDVEVAPDHRLGPRSPASVTNTFASSRRAGARRARPRGGPSWEVDGDAGLRPPNADQVAREVDLVPAQVDEVAPGEAGVEGAQKQRPGSLEVDEGLPRRSDSPRRPPP